MVSKFIKFLFCVILLGGIINANASVVVVNTTIFDDTPVSPGHPKTPVQPPYVWQDDYTLTFDDSCLGCDLRLVDENDNVVYTTVITSNTLVLPSYLSGEYELQIFSGIYCFYGYIEL